ncbi:hypothetical protein ACQ4PT_051410 [Festuca glaucescens]
MDSEFQAKIRANRIRFERTRIDPGDSVDRQERRDALRFKKVTRCEHPESSRAGRARAARAAAGRGPSPPRGRRRPRHRGGRGDDDDSDGNIGDEEEAVEPELLPQENIKDLSRGIWKATRKKNPYRFEVKTCQADPRFWTLFQEQAWHEFYSTLKKPICVQHVLDQEYYEVYQNNYFRRLHGVLTTMDILPLANVKQNFCPELVARFYATVWFQEDNAHHMSFMCGHHKIDTTFGEFAASLGYPWRFSSEDHGYKLHSHHEFDREMIEFCYPVEEPNLPFIADMYLHYNLLAKIFRDSIVIKSGDVSVVRAHIMQGRHIVEHELVAPALIEGPPIPEDVEEEGQHEQSNPSSSRVPIKKKKKSLSKFKRAVKSIFLMCKFVDARAFEANERTKRMTREENARHHALGEDVVDGLDLMPSQLVEYDNPYASGDEVDQPHHRDDRVSEDTDEDGAE